MPPTKSPSSDSSSTGTPDLAAALRALPLPNTSKADEVIAWLERHVEEVGIEVGDRLPHVAEIVKHTGLSQTCVREAMTRLSAFGIIEARRHAGTRLVRPLSAHNLMRILSTRELPDIAFGHVGGMRSALEMGFAPEVFRRCKKEDVVALREICQRMEAAAANREAFIECEIAFHSRLIEITGNAMARWLWQMLEPFFRSISPVRSPIPEPVIAKHRHIVDALEQRKRGAFLEEIHAHHDRKLAWDSERYKPGFLDEAFKARP